MQHIDPKMQTGKLSIYMHNVGDKEYITDILESGVVTGQTVPQGVLGPPRTVGVKLNFSF